MRFVCINMGTGNQEPRGPERAAAAKTPAATAEHPTKADNPLPCAREASGTLATGVRLVSALPPGGEDSALQRSRERALAQGLGRCSGRVHLTPPLAAPTGGWSSELPVRRRGLLGVGAGGPSQHCGKENHPGQGRWGEGQRGGVSSEQTGCLWCLSSG